MEKSIRLRYGEGGMVEFTYYRQDENISIVNKFLPRGSITVQLCNTDSDGNEIYINDTFYTALFSDENGKKRVSDIMPIKSNGESSNTVTFNDLEIDRTYYVFLVDKNGNSIDKGVTAGGGSYVPIYQAVEPTAEYPDPNIYIMNLIYGSESVYKRIELLTGDNYNVTDTFYVALFEDEARTIRVSEVMPIVFYDEYWQGVTFNDLALNTPYYVSEVDSWGNPIDNGKTSDGGVYGALFADGNRIELTPDDPNQFMYFENVFAEIPRGSITVTKELKTMASEDLKGVKDTFYVALFEDEARTKRVSEVMPMKFNGESSKTVTFYDLALNTPYYVSEVDKNGIPLDNAQTGDGGVYAAVFKDGNVIELTTEVPDKDMSFENVFVSLPHEY